ncbi:MAG: hypothetical protein NTW21_35325 [Verrucomicrobia bacterium]|nr:hypothetical protein [Verrucomicrobiota bacterium]
MKLPLLLSSLLLSTSALHAETNGRSEFLKTKYGFFVHYVWGGSQDQPFTCDPNLGASKFPPEPARDSSASNAPGPARRSS